VGAPGSPAEVGVTLFDAADCALVPSLLAARTRNVYAVPGVSPEMVVLGCGGVPVIVLLFDDKGYGVLRNLQDTQPDGKRIGVDLFTPDFETLACTLGWEALVVRSVDEFRPALSGCEQTGGPTVMVVDMQSIGDMARPFVPPIE